MHCGLCQIEVKDWKIHVAGLLHRKNLEKAANGELGFTHQAIATGIQAKKAMKNLDESFNELKKCLSGEETAEIARKGMEKDKA